MGPLLLNLAASDIDDDKVISIILFCCVTLMHITPSHLDRGGKRKWDDAQDEAINVKRGLKFQSKSKRCNVGIVGARRTNTGACVAISMRCITSSLPFHGTCCCYR